MMNCDFCEGKGQMITKPVKGHRYSTSFFWVTPCPKCKGTGQVEIDIGTDSALAWSLEDE